MPRSSHIPLYSALATSLHEKPLRYISLKDLDEMRSQKKAVLVSRFPLRAQLLAPERNDGHSPCSITAREMQLNAGVADWDDSRGTIFRAQDKVAMWPFVGDTKAVRVSPRT